MIESGREAGAEARDGAAASTSTNMSIHSINALAHARAQALALAQAPAPVRSQALTPVKRPLAGIENDDDLIRVYDDDDNFCLPPSTLDLPGGGGGAERYGNEDGDGDGDGDDDTDTRSQGAGFDEHEHDTDRELHERFMTPPDVMFDEFRDQVKTWMEVDNSIRHLQVMIRERRAYKKGLTDKITQFMKRYDLTNLDMGSAGVIRSRRSQVKAPISQRAIKDGIASYFESQNNATLGMQLTDIVFNNRQRKERVSLHRSLPGGRNAGNV